MSLYVNKRVSFYKDKSITDDMIMNCVGVVTYTYLCRKFPNWFRVFKECHDVIKIEEGNLPSDINLFISEDPYEIKKDLVLHLCGENINTNHLLLCNRTCKPTYPLMECEDSFYSWIFICIVMVILIFIAIYTIYYLDTHSYIK